MCASEVQLLHAGMYCIHLDKLKLCMQAKLQEEEKTSTEQAAQISSLREELSGSLADLDQVRIATRLVSKGDTGGHVARNLGQIGPETYACA